LTVRLGSLRRVLTDKEKGSSTLALEALRTIKLIVRGRIDAAEEAFRLMSVCRPEMSVLKNVGESGSKLLERGLTPLEACDALIEDLHHSIVSSVEHGLSLLRPGSNVLTLSNSEQIRSFLCDARNPLDKVYVLESRPGGEGAILFKHLMRSGVDAYLVADLDAYNMSETTDCFVSGSDSIGKTAFVNKLGTRSVAQLFRLNGKKVYSLTTKWKVESNPASNNVRVHLVSKKGKRDMAPLFEAVPNSFVDLFVTDVGLLKPNEVHIRLANELKYFRSKT
jgi:translation initiation factor 2B subunit (eIF-2B alpha/beta/delta family)